MAYELGRRMGPARGAWNEYIQLRVAKTANVLSQTKPLKMLGLSSTLSNYLQRFRVQEIVYTKMFRKLTATMVGSSMCLRRLLLHISVTLLEILANITQAYSWVLPHLLLFLLVHCFGLRLIGTWMQAKSSQ